MRVSLSKQMMRVFLAAVLSSASSLAVFAVTTNAPAVKPGAPATKSTAPTATTNVAPVEIPIPQSVFVAPRSKGDGVDPFYPRSIRLELAAPVSSTNKTQVVGELVINGFSGTPAQPLVIINNRTFGVDEEKEVATPQGRVRVRCIEIHLKDEATMVEVNGERRELRFRRGK